MRYSDRSNRTPYVKPVKRVELPDKDVKRRMILIVLFLAIAVVAIMTGLFSALRTEPGWELVTATSQEPNCAEDFTLNYDFTDAGSAATSQHKALTTLYTSGCENAFRIFSPDVQAEGLYNVHYLNAHPNETVTVDETLYEALSLVQRYGNRNLYLAGVYVEYNRIFLSENEAMAATYDPAQNPELMDYIEQAVSFANDPQMIDVQLLEENQVCLKVSDAYLSFAEEYGIESLIDFGWMKNAFIADYLAEVLTENGFTSGYLASFDGFTRNLDNRRNSYSFNIFDRRGDSIYIPAVMNYESPCSIVFLRDYPMVEKDRWHYFSFTNGRTASVLIAPADGMNKASVDSLVCYGEDAGCAQLLMQMIPLYITETFSADGLSALAENGIFSIWCEDLIVKYNQQDVTLNLQPQEDVVYSKTFSE